MVSVSLDNETVELWESLPVGERSKRLREALKQASIVNERDMLVEALRKQIKHKDKSLLTYQSALIRCKCDFTKGCHFEGNDFYFHGGDE